METKGKGRRPPAAASELPESDVAWVAGVLDMKGTVIRKNNKMRATPQLVLIVETRHHEVIRELARLTGTQPEMQAPKSPAEWMRKGCVEHCPTQHVHVGERGYEWSMPAIGRFTITGAGAAVLLYNVLPYMRRPREFPEALEAMLAYTVTYGQGWGATRTALKRLLRKGWRMPPQFKDLDLEGAA